MLTEQKIREKSEKYLNAGKQYGAFNDDLIEFLGVDIMNAPSSPNADMYGAFKGGLIEHMLLVSKHAVNINEQLPNNIKQDKEQLIKISFIHQIGKTFLFKPQTDEWRQKNLGENFTYNNDLTSMKVGERSAYYALKHGIELTEDEYQAIINSDKDFDKQAKYFTCGLGVILKQANELAIMELKEKYNKDE